MNAEDDSRVSQEEDAEDASVSSTPDRSFDESLNLARGDDVAAEGAAGSEAEGGGEDAAPPSQEFIERVESLMANVDVGTKSTEDLMGAYRGREDELVRVLERLNSLKAFGAEGGGGARGEGSGCEDGDGGFGSLPLPEEHFGVGAGSGGRGDAASAEVSQGGRGMPRRMWRPGAKLCMVTLLPIIVGLVIWGILAISTAPTDNVPGEASSSTPFGRADLSKYGYPHHHRKKDATGWISWPIHADYDYGDLFLLFGAEDGVTSLEECAARCRKENAPVGSWSVNYNACWCSYSDASTLCKEPCVEGSTVDFSETPLYMLGYCQKSVCDDDWYHSEEYCTIDVEFDSDACDAKLAMLSEAGTVAPAPATEPGGADDSISIEPIALLTTMASNPDATYGGQQDLSIQNDERVSYIRFDLSSVEGTVTHAVLNLFLVTQSKSMDAATIVVDALPNSDAWAEGSYSHDDPPNLEGEFNVNSFSVVPLKSEDGAELLYEIDVTSGIIQGNKWATFRLTTESTHRWYFASEGWAKGKFRPELLVTVAPPGTETGMAAPAPATEPGGADDSVIVIEASALQTAMKSHPDAKYGGKQDLSVQNDDRISFIRFDLPPALLADGVTATLKLYLVTWSENRTADTIVIDALPNGGDWEHGSVSWNEQPDSEDSFEAGTFSVAPLENKDDEKKLYQVDVTPAIRPGDERITLRLTTTSGRRWYFASQGWCEGVCTPELLITPASPKPVTSPTATENDLAVPGGSQWTVNGGSVVINPWAMETIIRDYPDATWGGMTQLAVERESQISYIIFHLSSYLDDNTVVTSATLSLYSITQGKDEDAIEVDVDALPNAGGWVHGELSWNNQPNEEGLFNVKSFSVVPKTSLLNMVDVTSAINSGYQWITFKISTESDATLYFAGAGWEESEVRPSLLVNVASSELSPSVPATNPITSLVIPTSSPVVPAALPPAQSPLVQTGSTVKIITIDPSAVQTAMKSHPNATWGGMEELAVQKDSRISYVRFDLSSKFDAVGRREGDGAVVIGATLNLHTVTQTGDGDTITVNVDALPNYDEWTTGSIAWNNPLLDEDEWFGVTTFSLVPLALGLHEVDVASAIDPSYEWITFRLSSDSDTMLYFASSEWDDIQARPSLVVSLAFPEPTAGPTESPLPPTVSPVAPTMSPLMPSASPLVSESSPVAPTSPLMPSTSPAEDLAVPVDMPPGMMGNSTGLVMIKPKAVQTAMKGHPDAKWGGKEELTISHDNRISYIRFDLSAISGGDSVTVTSATLNLYHVANSEHTSLVTVDVDVLPDAGDWTHGSISWIKPPETDGWHNVYSFAATPLQSGLTKELHEIDVTSEISPWDEWITFRLSTDSSQTLSIASEDWKEGEALPMLVVTVS